MLPTELPFRGPNYPSEARQGTFAKHSQSIRNALTEHSQSTGKAFTELPLRGPTGESPNYPSEARQGTLTKP